MGSNHHRNDSYVANAGVSSPLKQGNRGVERNQDITGGPVASSGQGGPHTVGNNNATPVLTAKEKKKLKLEAEREREKELFELNF